MIYEIDAKQYYEYPIFVVTSAMDDEFSGDIIIEPMYLVDKYGMESCYFIIGSFIYIFKLGTFNGDLKELKNETLTDDNVLTILTLKKGETMQLVKKYVGL